jgi:dehydro coenzyme F420 reductase / coenzyme F420-0:L-glutamate ligase / coenzyme F420-1:gamma-L-glutamate ligase
VTVELIPLQGLPEVRPGDDLAAMLEPALAANAASDGDVVVITQKVVSKAEGRVVPSDDRAGWIDRETVGVVARRGDLVIARTRHGFVCANAGVDASNIRTGFLTLLPEDPDASAERLQKELLAGLGLSRLGVVITDTFGRPWREGVLDVAIGCAGLAPLVDLRGTTDDRGRLLETTVVAFADAVAAASGLVMTKTGRVPAALVRGLEATPGGAPPGPARALVRAAEEDLFRESTMVALSSTRRSRSFAVGSVPREAVEDAVRTACAAASGDRWLFVVLDSPASRRRLLLATGASERAALEAAPVLIVPCMNRRDGHEEPDQRLLLSGGAGIRNLVLALHAQHLGWSWDPGIAFEPDRVREALALDDGWLPLGVVAAGRMSEAGAFGPRPPFDLRQILDWRG